MESLNSNSQEGESHQLQQMQDKAKQSCMASFRLLHSFLQAQESKVDSSKALDASLVVTACSGTKSDKHDTSSSSRTYITHVEDADIRPVNDQVLFTE
ncbi:hypothetical protein Tco_1233677, partial [Tanacetum coccineum]